MTSPAESFLSMLEALREDYVEVGERTCETLRLVDVDTSFFSRVWVAAMAESRVDGIIHRASDGGDRISEQEVRSFAAVHREGVERACAALAQLGLDIVSAETLWSYGVWDAGAGELLGICHPVRHGGQAVAHLTSL